MASMMRTALLELPGCFWNLLKSNSPRFGIRKVSQELIVKQEAIPESIIEDYNMPRSSIQNYKEESLLASESENEEVENTEAEKEKPWEGRLEPREHVTTANEGYEDWSPQELDFFNCLNDRGVTPMLWSYWKPDFPTLPSHLFTAEKEDALIKNWEGLASRGAKALNLLVQTGVYARERQQSRRNPAQLLAKEITRYIKWSYKDAKWRMNKYIPLIVVNYAGGNEALEVAEARGQAQVKELGQQYEDLWRNTKSEYNSPPPTIFHIFLAKTIMGFESYDCSSESPEFRSIFFTDWKQFGHDIWNAMAVAILVEQCRSWLAEVDPERPHSTEEVEIDPDL